METTEKTELICQDCKFPLARHAIYKDNLCPVVVIRSMPDAPADLLKLAHEAVKKLVDDGCSCDVMSGISCSIHNAGYFVHSAIDRAVNAAYSKGHHDGRGFDPHGGEDA